MPRRGGPAISGSQFSARLHGGFDESAKAFNSPLLPVDTQQDAGRDLFAVGSRPGDCKPAQFLLSIHAVTDEELDKLISSLARERPVGSGTSQPSSNQARRSMLPQTAAETWRPSIPRRKAAGFCHGGVELGDVVG